MAQQLTSKVIITKINTCNEEGLLNFYKTGIHTHSAVFWDVTSFSLDTVEVLEDHTDSKFMVEK